MITMRTLMLKDNDIKGLLSMDEIMAAVESAFRETGLHRVQMPPKLYLFYNRYNGDLRVMPSYLEELDVSAVKIVNVHPDNREKHGLPTVMATIMLLDPSNGVPLSIMGGTWITNMRTGAAGGVAAKYLARRDSRVVGIVGAGAQGRTQLMSLLELFKKFDEVRVWDLAKTNRDLYITEMRQAYGSVATFTPVDDVKGAAKGADIVVTTTPSRKPLVLSDWITTGTHLNCIGADAPGKQELDPAILTRAKVVVDNWEQASHSGEINVPLAKNLITRQDIWAELGEIVAGKKMGRVSQDEITVFDSTGLAVQDAVTANLAYQKAFEAKVGQYVEVLS
jgi:alanine dehydrogenase